MVQESQSTEGRALLTETERDALAGEKSDSYRYKTRSYLKRRIEKIERDADVLAEYAPDLLADLRDAIETDETHGPREPRESAETPSQSERDRSGGENTTTSTTPETAPTSDARADGVEEVADAEGWEDTPERLDARKRAALAVLEYAREHGSVSKAEAKEEIEPEHPVDGQNSRTWYRKNIRPVLNESAEYDQSERGYRLTLAGE